MIIIMTTNRHVFLSALRAEFGAFFVIFMFEDILAL